ncbi:SRC kinase signaling inhibitor 1, partial [Manacus vitellinus]|uniref:SRC kinase signaling inhibitor 1 n=1 Tax=Manacus vitellinus TaxID=328815 RepID=UPI00115D7DAF
REYRTLGNGTRRFSNVGLVHTSERRHTVIAAQSLEALTGLQKTEMERKRDAFMDHLKSKYPQHALALRGQQERMRDQTRSSRHSQGSQPGLADQAKLSFASAESLETMSEAELPLGFNRMNRFRQSLPLSRSTSQTKLRSPGVLFLQFGDETRRVHITHEISSMDTLHALIVHMFPQKLTMGMLKSPNTAILIKDESRNVFYELEDVRDIQDRSIIKIYRKEPLYASFPASHITNGDLRLQNQEAVKTLLRRTETEISVRVTDTVRKHEDPLQRQRSLVEEERLRYLNEEELITQQLNDLEKSVEKIQKDLAHNHRLIPVQELEEKAVVLKQLGETLTDLKAQFPSLQSKMRVVLRVEVEAVKFLKEEPNRLDGLLKRCKTVTDTLAQIRRQVDEGVWTSPSNLSQSPKKVAPETDFSKGLDLEMPTSPPVSLGMPSFGHSPPQTQSHPSKTPVVVFQRSSASPFLPKLHHEPLVAVCPGLAELWPNGASIAAQGWKVTGLHLHHLLSCLSLTHFCFFLWFNKLMASLHTPRSPSFVMAHPLLKLCQELGSALGTSAVPVYTSVEKSKLDGGSRVSKGVREEPLALAVPGSRAFSLPQIVLTEWVSEPPSPEAEPEVPEGLCQGPVSPRRPATPGSKELYEDTYQRLDSLEETIRELEMTISEISSHPSVESVFPKNLLGPAGPKEAGKETRKGLGDLSQRSCDDGTVLDLSQARDDAPRSPSPSKTKPPLLPKPQLPPGIPQATRPSKEASETSPTVSEKPASGRTSIPVLTSFGARNSSISF